MTNSPTLRTLCRALLVLALAASLSVLATPVTAASGGGGGFGSTCPAQNDAGCAFSDIVCSGYNCCCVYAGAGCSAPSTGPCWPTSPCGSAGCF